ncbi:putative aminoadipate reductase [Mycena crocata]|nr:putative aminoadipate reductase [Mycena crocata]
MSFSHLAESASLRLPEVVALNSQTNPHAPLYLYAKPDASSDIVTITNLEFERATHRAAQILRPNREGADGEVVAVIALSDSLLYQAVVIGLVTAHLIPFPISPRNSPAAVVQLLKKTSCHRIIATCVTLELLIVGVQQTIRQTHPDYRLDVDEIPSVSQVFPNLDTEMTSNAVESYAAPTSLPAADDIAMYLHSSGSTGFPKAIPQTHRILMQWGSFAAVTHLRDHIQHPVASMALPPFHLAGTYCHILQPIYGGVPVALYPPTALTPRDLPFMPTPDSILEHARKTKSKAMFIFPTFLIVWSKSPEAIAYLSTLDFVGCSGGSVPPRVGDILANAGVKLRPVYAGTEFGALTTLKPLPGDENEWAWAQFADRIKLRWEPQGDDTFECQILTHPQHHLCVENLQDVQGYGTSDLWVNHPKKKHLWKIVGRIDDVIVHTSAEKTVPAPMEGVVMSSPLVAGTVMFGRDRDQAGILIEPAVPIDVKDEARVAELRNKLWPIIEEANAIAPPFSRIFKEMILFTSPDKLLPRAGKGTVLRKAALDVYAAEIDALYELVSENSNTIRSIKPPSAWETLSIQFWLLELVTELTDLDNISSEADLFQQGFDSLSATFLRLRILGSMKSAQDAEIRNAAMALTQNLVYSHPTISQLATFLHGLVSGTLTDAADAKTAIEEMIAKYTVDLVPSFSVVTNAGGPAVVLITGSSGNLGSQILASLLQDGWVEKIYAYNRPSLKGLTSAERHRARFEDRGLDVGLLSSSKLSFIEGQIEEKGLGLPTDLYTEIRDSATVIIHSSWALDFNMGLASFEPHIRGTRHVVDFALACTRAPRFVFMSSVAGVLSWDRASGACPEELVGLGGDVDPSHGYGQSKFVAEQIIAKSGLNASILRIGQICGSPPKGAWATSDWLPILVKTSITMGYLPLVDGLVSWIDFDTVSQAVMDVAFSTEAALVFNLVHPKPVPWNAVIGSLQSEIRKYRGNSPQLVSFQDWRARLDSAASKDGSHANDDNLPGIKLLHFFHQLADTSVEYDPPARFEFGTFDFSTEKMCSVSSAVRDVQAMSEEHFKLWVAYWSSVGFI